MSSSTDLEDGKVLQEPTSGPYKSRQEVVAAFGKSTIIRKLDSFDAVSTLFGDPTKSGFASNIKPILVSGFGPDHNKDHKINLHTKLHALFVAAFKELNELKLSYTLWACYTGGQYFRYKNNASNRKYLRDSSDYDQIRQDKWGGWAADCANFDLKNNRFGQEIDFGKTKQIRKNLLSNHAFGIAFDLNYATNQFSETAIFDMPKEIVQVFAKYGFDWGGYYHDYMHFEYMLDHILDSANVPVAPPEVAPKKQQPQKPVKPAPPPPPGKSSAPIPASSISSLMSSMEFAKDWLEREWQQDQDKKREEEVEEAHDAIQSDSGYFPIGLNLTWHGGIHCRASRDGSVHAMTDGIVVAARLPEKDPAKLSYGSRNFVLVKHKTPLGKPFWTLYMHLRPILLKPDDPNLSSVFPWLLKRSLTRVGEGISNLRKAPDAEHGEVIRELEPGETFDVLDDQTVGSQKWFFVLAKKDQVTGWAAFTSKFEFKSEIPGLEDIKAGKVVKLSAPVKRGDCLGFICPAPAGKDPFLHWEVFSDGVVSDQWIQVKDDDALKNDIVCDAVEFKQIMNKSKAVTFLHPLNKDNIREAYNDPKTAAQIRSRTFFFKSEWAVVWDAALDRLKSDYDVKDLAPRLQLYNFWKDAEALGCDLPKGGSVWHYHPTEFMAREYPVPKAAPPDSQDGKADDFDIDWDFIAKLEGTSAKVYVPIDKNGSVLGKSGPTIASGFDLGQIDMKDFDSYEFSQSVHDKLKNYVGMIGQDALAFVNANECILSNEEVHEVHMKVKSRYANKAERFFNQRASEDSQKFKQQLRPIQTSFASVFFQYGTASTLRGNLLQGDILGGIETLLHFTKLTTTYKYQGRSTKVMQYLNRRIAEAEYLSKALPSSSLSEAAETIKAKKQEWKDATGKPA